MTNVRFQMALSLLAGGTCLAAVADCPHQPSPYAERLASYCRTAPSRDIRHELSLPTDSSPDAWAEALGDLWLASDAARRTGRVLFCAAKGQDRRAAAIATAFGDETGACGVLAQFRNVNTHFVNMKPLEVALGKFGAICEERVDIGCFRAVCTADSSPLLVGDFVLRETPVGTRAIVVVPLGDWRLDDHTSREVRFRTGGTSVLAYDATGLPLNVMGPEAGAFSVSVPVGSPAVVTVEPDAVLPKVDRSRVLIGSWRFRSYLWDEEHVREYKDAGMDLSCIAGEKGKDTKVVLDLFEKHGIGCFICRREAYAPMPYWGAWLPAGTMREKNPISDYDAAKAAYVDHPAIWGFTICDEPNAMDLPYIGEVVDRLKGHYPGKIMYFDLLPNYGTLAEVGRDKAKSQLGTRTYAEHIDIYMKEVSTDYLSYDFFVYQDPDDRRLVQKMYDNYDVVAKACRRGGRSFWYAPMVNSRRPALWTSANMLRFQAYSAMAYGAEMINWCCWCPGWFTNQVVEANGKRTAQYERVKKVNGEIRRLGETFMRYRNTATHLVGFDGTEWLQNTPLRSKDTVDTGFFRDVCMADGSAAVVGEMVARKDTGARAIFVFSADDPYDVADRTHVLRFRVPGGRVRISGPDGEIRAELDADGIYRVPIHSSGCVMVERFGS